MRSKAAALTLLFALPSAAMGKAAIRWVRIPGGRFTMGSSDPDISWARPAHGVTVKGFEMAKTLVTNKQYKACVAAGACTAAHVSDGTCRVYNGDIWSPGFPSASFLGDEQPVVCVDWVQAKAFCAWAGGRLPSEAEWEYAARGAGKDWKHPWGNEDATCERAVIMAHELGCGRSSTWPVCSKPRGNTPQGLCDMAGNAWEWVQDWFHDSYEGAPADGSAWESPAGSRRVLRGGSWSRGAGGARSATRNYDAADYNDYRIGFRPVR